MVCKTAVPDISINAKSCFSDLQSGNGWVLSAQQINFIRTKPYMYNCYVSSVMELLFLQKFWYWISQFVPSRVAPCSLTVIGLIINIACSSALIYYSPDAKQITPWWTLIVCATGLFVYQIFDALDGKQAVKVQDTQLEEVYDHGCDAVSCIFVTLSVAIATQIGYYPEMQFLFFLISMLAFYMTHFACHITHVMVFGRIDVIEGQWAMIIVHCVTAACGQQLWSYVVYGNITLLHVLFILTIIGLLASMVSNTLLILGSDSPMDAYIRIPRNSRTNKWNPFIPMAIITVLAINCYASGDAFQRNSIAFTFCFGISIAKLAFKLQMMNVTHGVMPPLDSSIVGPLLLAINSYYPMLDTHSMLYVVLCYALCDYVFYFVFSSIDLKSALDVNIFTLKYACNSGEQCRHKNYGFNLNGTENEQALKNMHKCGEHLLISNYY